MSYVCSGCVTSRARFGVRLFLEKERKDKGSKDQADKILMAVGMSQSAAAVTKAIAALLYNP